MNLARWDGRLRLLPCVVCVALGRPQPNPCHELHHLGDPSTSERNEYAKVPICDEHHQGPEGIHGLHRRGFVHKNGITDLVLLTLTVMLAVREMP